MAPIRFTLLGEAASKANSRQIVSIGGQQRVIKSKKARDFTRDARRQVPPSCRLRLQGPVAVMLRMFYATERPDLDESIVLDAMQDHYAITRLGPDRVRRDLVQAGVYCNDRQVRWKLVIHAIDRAHPRVEVAVVSIDRQGDMFAALAPDEQLPF
jgi:Holliday junction resolvase RusA-like endonuclease